MGVGADDIAELIARAYEAAADPARWPRFLEKLCTAFEDETCTFQLHDVRTQAGSFAYAYGIDPAVERVYAEHYAALNPWTGGGTAIMQAGRVVFGEMVLSKRELERTEFFADFLRLTNVAHSMAAVVARDDDTAAFVALQRSAARGQYTAEERAVLATLMPHLQRSLELHRRLGVMRMRDQALSETADRLPWGVVFLDRRRNVVFANTVARAFDRRMMTRIIAAATAGGGTIARPERRPLAVTVAPLRADDPLVALDAPTFAVFVVDPDAQRGSPVDWLRDAYRLTAAEARIAIAVAHGDSLEQIAEATETRIATVRSHLKRVFAKTSTGRQSELVRLVLLGAPIG